MENINSGGLGIVQSEEIAPSALLSPMPLREEIVEAYFDDAGLWCILRRQGEEVWIEKNKVLYVYKAVDIEAV